jgi:L-amino acid N-acyltransferase YncA
MSSNDYAIRRATADDARGIAEVHVASWRSAYRGLVADDVLDGLSVDRREEGWKISLTVHRERAAVLVVEQGERIAGFAAVGAPEANEDVDASGKVGELYSIYLRPDAWGQGMGKQLLEEAQNELRAAGFSEAVLWVVEGNERSRRFYELAGWAVDGGRRTECMPGLETPAVRYRRAL